MKRFHLPPLFFVFSIFLLSPTFSRAQQNLGRQRKAHLTIQMSSLCRCRLDTKETAKTNADDNDLVQHLIPDVYKVRLEVAGFSSTESEAIQISADTSQRVDIQLKAGSVSETIEITSEAPQLKTDRADVATILNTRSIEDLANLIRNATSFTLLGPGTAPSGINNAIGENPQQ
jgi:hypothetical protein